MKRWILTILIAILVSYTFGNIMQSRLDQFQGMNAKDWANKANGYNKKLKTEETKNASLSAFLVKLENEPTPTPIIKYQTQYTQTAPQTLPQPQVKCLAYEGSKCVEEQLPSGSF